MNDPNLLFQAQLVDKDGKKDIEIKVNTGHLPMMAYAVKLLDMHLENKILQANMKKDMADKPKIAVPVGGVKDFLKR